MSDETPTNDPAPTPAAETPAASTPAPEAPAAPETPAPAAAETPTPAASEPSAPAPEPPTAPAESPTPPAPEAATAADTQPEIPVAAAAVTEPEIPVVTAAPATGYAAPVAAAPVAAVAAVAATDARSGSHVAVPKWVLATVAGVLGAAVMFGIGYAVGDGADSNDSNTAIGAPQAPTFPGNQGGGAPQAPSSPGGNQGGNQGGSQSTSGAFLGVATQQTTGGLEVVQVVSGSAADDAGIEVGDVIVEFDGNDVTTPAQLANAVSNLDPGDEVEVTYERDGDTDTVTVELGSRNTANSN